MSNTNDELLIEYKDPSEWFKLSKVIVNTN